MKKDDKLVDIKRIEVLFRTIGKALTNENLTPRDALIIVSTMSQSLFEVMINDPEFFANGKLDEVLGIREDGN